MKYRSTWTLTITGLNWSCFLLDPLHYTNGITMTKFSFSWVILIMLLCEIIHDYYENMSFNLIYETNLTNLFMEQTYSIQHYVIQFFSDMRQVGGFLRVLRFPPPIKLTATILLKVALNSISLKAASRWQILA